MTDSMTSEAGETTAEALRRDQVDCYVNEDFDRYFALSARLATLSPGYTQSYEFALQSALHALAKAVPELSFLQVGAMDGKRFDPIYAFVQHYRWSGVILEPLPDLFDALSTHYAGHPGVTLVRAALMEADGSREMMRVERGAAADGSVPIWAEGLGSFHPERNALGGVGVDPDLHAALLRHARREPVDCMTLETLVRRHGLPRIDLLQVDAEGCELEIWRQVERLGFTPRVVHLEHWALSLAERGELLGRLGACGYLLRMSESDVLAVDPSLKAALDARAGWPC